MHQRLRGARQEAVVDEKVFLNVQRRIAPLQIARAVVLDPVAQRQVLRARRSTNRVGLDKAQSGDGLGQGGGRKQHARDGIAAQGLQGDGHGCGRVGLGNNTIHAELRRGPELAEFDSLEGVEGDL